MRSGTTLTSVALTIVVVACSPARADQLFFVGLGDLPGGAHDSIPYAITPDGSMVVGGSESASGVEAFWWTLNDGMVGLGDLSGGGFYSNGLGLSANGSVIVGQGTDADSPRSAVRWQDGIIADLGELTAGAYSEAWGVSADGTAIVGGSGNEAFLWAESTGMTGLGDLPGGMFSSLAGAISADGSIIVGRGNNSSGRPEAVRWVGGVPQGLGFLSDGLESNAMDVSADGLVIVGNSNTTPSGDTRAFRWENGVMTNLGSLPGEEGSGAWAVSADGSVVVGGAAYGGDSVPFIWDATNGMRNIQDLLVDDLGLSLDGWTLHGNAEDVTADGQTIIGFGTNPDGYTEAWIAHIPEPATLSLVLFGGIMTLRRRRTGGRHSIEGRLSC